MTYGILIQEPDSPINERWSWETDIQESYNGTEDRIPLLRYPKRSFSGSFTFDSKTDLQRHLAMMTRRFRGEFILPLFQYQSKLKSPVDVGDTSLPVTTRRLNLVAGEQALLVEGDKTEAVTVTSISANALGLSAPIVSSFSARAIVCPFATVYPSGNTSVSRRTVDGIANSSFEFTERVPRSAIVSANNTAELVEFDGLPLLPYKAKGIEFESSLTTGLRPIDYLAQNDLVSPWIYSQWNYSATFLWTEFDPEDVIDWWEVFADTIQGSCYPFLFPTNREDFEIVTPAASTGTTITVQGTGYSEHYFAHDAFKRIAISTEAGVHYAKITGVAVVGGNDRLTFTPALPNGAAWEADQKISFLLKVRMADDKLILNHYGLYTEVNLPLRTVI